MIDDTRKLIFIHPEKSGGTSIERAFGAKIVRRNPELSLFRAGRMHAKWGVPVVIWEEQVMSATQFAMKYPDRWESYRKIAVVRNPVNRLVSRHRYFLKQDKALCCVAGDSIGEDGIWRDLLLADIRCRSAGSFGPVVSQTKKLGELDLYDFILKLESIGDDWKRMVEHLKLEGLPEDISHHNKSEIVPVDIMSIVTEPKDRVRLAVLLREDLINFRYIVSIVSKEEQTAILEAAPQEDNLNEFLRTVYPA